MGEREGEGSGARKNVRSGYVSLLLMSNREGIRSTQLRNHFFERVE